MQRSEEEGITDHLLVHMVHIAFVLIHRRGFSLAQTREQCRTLPCGSVCRGSEDLMDSEDDLWRILTQKMKQAHSTGTEVPLVQLMPLMFYDSF